MKGLPTPADTGNDRLLEKANQVAIPMERARQAESNLAWSAENELRSVAQLKMLHRLARRLNELNDVGQIAEAITGELRALIDYHNCRVHLISEDGATLVPIAFRGGLSAYQGETFDALILKVGEGVTGRVAASGESYYAPNTNTDPYAVLIPGTPELDESLLVVPLRYGARVIGTVALAKLGIDQFDAEDQRLLEVLASHAAVAIENAQLLEEERQQAITAQGLLNFSQSLTRVHGLEQVLAEAVASIPTLIECSAVQVYLRNPATGGFRWALGPPLGPPSSEEVYEVPADVAGHFFRSTEHPFVLPADVVASVPTEYRRLDFMGEVLIAPLRWEPDGLGAIVILAPSETAKFDARDLALAQGMADITSLALGNASAFDELQQAAERLRALDEMKNTFLDAVSHELRTPLAAVLGIALTLQRKDISLSLADSQDLVARLAANARKLQRLLSDLLDLDRLARGIVQPNCQPTDVEALVRRVVENTDLGDHQVSIDVEPMVVDMDAPKVERILENLLANAARHTGRWTQIWVRATSSDGGILLVVEDEGEGVPEGLREAIFEPFRQGPRRSPHSPGVGIGLSLVARFAELHGGRAWVEDRPGGGASFRVFLPVAGSDVTANRGA